MPAGGAGQLSNVSPINMLYATRRMAFRSLEHTDFIYIFRLIHGGLIMIKPLSGLAPLVFR